MTDIDAVMVPYHCLKCDAEYTLARDKSVTCGKCLERREVVKLKEGPKPPPTAEERLDFLEGEAAGLRSDGKVLGERTLSTNKAVADLAKYVDTVAAKVESLKKVVEALSNRVDGQADHALTAAHCVVDKVVMRRLAALEGCQATTAPSGPPNRERVEPATAFRHGNTICERIVRYLGDLADGRATAAEISEGIDARPKSVRKALSLGHPTIFERDGKDGDATVWKLKRK